MSLRTIDAAPAVVARIRARLLELIGDPDLAERRPRWPRSDQLEIALPHLVYGIGAEDLVGLTPLAAVQPVATRVLVYLGGALVAAAELAVDDRAEVVVTDGPHVHSTVRALELVEATHRSGDAEVRLLRASPLYLVALWVHGDDTDVIVPLEPAPDGLRALQAYPTSEIAEPFAGLARRHLSTRAPAECHRSRPDDGGGGRP